MEPTVVNIILVNYNGWKDTIGCIESIDKSLYPDFNVIIIDNNSNDNSVKNIIDWHSRTCNKLKLIDKIQVLDTNDILNNSFNQSNARLIVIKSNKNEGFASGNNIGINFCKKHLISKYTWLLNNDTKIDKKSLSHLVSRMENENRLGNKIGILGSKILNYDTPGQIQSIGVKYNKHLASASPIGAGEQDNKQYDDPSILGDYILGASLFLDNNFIEEVGLMNEEYFLFFEELDWILRGKRKDWIFGYEPNCKVWHKQGASTNLTKTSRNELLDYYQIRNRILFTKKFYPLCLFSVYPAIFFSFTKRILKKEFKAAKNILKLIFTT